MEKKIRGLETAGFPREDLNPVKNRPHETQQMRGALFATNAHGKTSLKMF
jgi:hypothetical protein